MKRLALGLAFLACMQCGRAQGDYLVYDSTRIHLRARDTYDSYYWQRTVDALPASGSGSVWAPDGTGVTTTYDLWTSDTTTEFTFQFDVSRTGISEYNDADFATGFDFQVSEPTRYDFAGFFASQELGTVYFNTNVAEVADGRVTDFVFKCLQMSHETEDQMFQVGGTDGDDLNELIGSPEGILLPGHNYQMLIYCYLAANDVADVGATGDGEFTFTLSPDPTYVDPNPVPEPSTFAALAGLSAMGLVFMRRHRRK